MYIYNVTLKVDNEIKREWLRWLKEEHIPDMIMTGCFTNASILQLLETDELEGATYAVQYQAQSKSLYNRYIEKFAGSYLALTALQVLKIKTRPYFFFSILNSLQL